MEVHTDRELEPIPPSEANWAYRILLRDRLSVLGWLNVYEHNRTGISSDNLHQLIMTRWSAAITSKKIMREILPAKELEEQAISIIICTRNRAPKLKSCLQSISLLAYQNYEVIVVDNAPDDDSTRQVAEAWGARYILEEKKGLDRARNKGISEAKNELVAFTDDDVRVDAFWLKNINRNFSNPGVMCVTGCVGPEAIDTWAQEVFELHYGGMGHGFERKFIRREKMNEERLLWASNFGIGANMSFRKKIFESIGGFDPALDLGTPSNGGGDIEMFHRLVVKGNLLVYDPSVFVWHQHRDNWKDLEKQVYNNGRSMGCFLVGCFLKRTVSRSIVLKFWLKDWWYHWALKNLLSPRSKIPKRLALQEIAGMISSPFAYFRSRRQS